MSLLKPLYTVQGIQGVSPVYGVQGVAPVQGARSVYPVRGIGYQPRQQQQFEQTNYKDPFAINSFVDVFFNEEAKRRRYGQTSLGTTIQAGLDFINESYVKPMLVGDVGKVILNSLNQFSEDMDVMSNLTKGMIIEPGNEKVALIVGAVAALTVGGAIMLTGPVAPAVATAAAKAAISSKAIALATGAMSGGMAAVGSSIILDPEGAMRGFEKGLGFTDQGRTQYDFNSDTGLWPLDLALNLTGEILVDPLNWMSLGKASLRRLIKRPRLDLDGNIIKSAYVMSNLDNTLLKAVNILGSVDLAVTKAAFLANPLGMGLKGLVWSSRLGLEALSRSRMVGAMTKVALANDISIKGLDEVVHQAEKLGTKLQSVVRNKRYVELAFLGEDKAIYGFISENVHNLIEAGVDPDSAARLIQNFVESYTFGATFKGMPEPMYRIFRDKFIHVAGYAEGGVDYAARNYELGVDAVKEYFKVAIDSAIAEEFSSKILNKKLEVIDEAVRKIYKTPVSGLDDYSARVRAVYDGLKEHHGGLFDPTELFNSGPYTRRLLSRYGVRAEDLLKYHNFGTRFAYDATDLPEMLLLVDKSLPSMKETVQNSYKHSVLMDQMSMYFHKPNDDSVDALSEGIELFKKGLKPLGPSDVPEHNIISWALDTPSDVYNNADLQNITKVMADIFPSFYNKDVIDTWMKNFYSPFNLGLANVVAEWNHRYPDSKKFYKALAQELPGAPAEVISQVHKVLRALRHIETQFSGKVLGVPFKDIDTVSLAESYLSLSTINVDKILQYIPWHSELYQPFHDSLAIVIQPIGWYEEALIDIEKRGGYMLNLNKIAQTSFMIESVLQAPIMEFIIPLMDNTTEIGQLFELLHTMEFKGTEFQELGEKTRSIFGHVVSLIQQQQLRTSFGELLNQKTIKESPFGANLLRAMQAPVQLTSKTTDTGHIVEPITDGEIPNGVSRIFDSSQNYVILHENEIYNEVLEYHKTLQNLKQEYEAKLKTHERKILNKETRVSKLQQEYNEKLQHLNYLKERRLEVARERDRTIELTTYMWETDPEIIALSKGLDDFAAYNPGSLVTTIYRITETAGGSSLDTAAWARKKSAIEIALKGLKTVVPTLQASFSRGVSLSAHTRLLNDADRKIKTLVDQINSVANLDKNDAAMFDYFAMEKTPVSFIIRHDRTIAAIQSLQQYTVEVLHNISEHTRNQLDLDIRSTKSKAIPILDMKFAKDAYTKRYGHFFGFPSMLSYATFAIAHMTEFNEKLTGDYLERVLKEYLFHIKKGKMHPTDAIKYVRDMYPHLKKVYTPLSLEQYMELANDQYDLIYAYGPKELFPALHNSNYYREGGGSPPPISLPAGTMDIRRPQLGPEQLRVEEFQAQKVEQTIKDKESKILELSRLRNRIGFTSEVQKDPTGKIIDIKLKAPEALTEAQLHEKERLTTRIQKLQAEIETIQAEEAEKARIKELKDLVETAIDNTRKAKEVPVEATPTPEVLEKALTKPIDVPPITPEPAPSSVPLELKIGRGLSDAWAEKLEKKGTITVDTPTKTTKYFAPKKQEPIVPVDQMETPPPQPITNRVAIQEFRDSQRGLDMTNVIKNSDLIVFIVNKKTANLANAIKQVKNIPYKDTTQNSLVQDPHIDFESRKPILVLSPDSPNIAALDLKLLIRNSGLTGDLRITFVSPGIAQLEIQRFKKAILEGTFGPDVNLETTPDKNLTTLTNRRWFGINGGKE
jgi:hypothetical protein